MYIVFTTPTVAMVEKNHFILTWMITQSTSHLGQYNEREQ